MSLVVLAVDDEPPALDELAYLLRADSRVTEVVTAPDATAALRVLDARPVAAVFLDIGMPGLGGLELAGVLARFAAPPAIVFVTAQDAAAVEAFALGAVDYLLKPLRAERLAEAVRRVADRPGTEAADDTTIPVELGGVIRFVPLADVRYVEAQGDYARLHTVDGSHLVRAALSTLAERWQPAGFVRVHRSYLVATAYVDELRVEPSGAHAVLVAGVALPVSRRHSRALKDRLVHRARGQAGS